MPSIFVLENHPSEAVAGLYLLGRLDGIDTPELQEVIRKRPLLRRHYEQLLNCLDIKIMEE